MPGGADNIVEATSSQSTTTTSSTVTSAARSQSTTTSSTVTSTAQMNGGTSTSGAPPGTPVRTAVVSSRPIFMPDSFSGQDREWADWADQFDMASEVNGWNDRKKLKMMTLLFTGKAREMYWGLAPEARVSYASLKRAMGNLLGLSKQADWNRAELHSRERGTNENERFWQRHPPIGR